MSEEGWITLAKIASGVIISSLGVIRIALHFWLVAKKEENEHRSALEKENIQLKKENIDKGFDQLKEADKFIRMALVQTAKALKDTTMCTIELRGDIKHMGVEFKETQATAALKIEAATTRIEALEVKIKSVVTELGEGARRVSGPKF